MHLSPRCGARTRSGTPCQSPAMANGWCRIHGGKSRALRKVTRTHVQASTGAMRPNRLRSGERSRPLLQTMKALARTTTELE
ncbi:MAG: HGGxSTG domain-containing protein [Methylocella sp.]